VVQWSLQGKKSQIKRFSDVFCTKRNKLPDQTVNKFLTERSPQTMRRLRGPALNPDKLRKSFFIKRKKRYRTKSRRLFALTTAARRRGLPRSIERRQGMSLADRAIRSGLRFLSGICPTLFVFEFHAYQMIAGYEIFTVSLQEKRLSADINRKSFARS
jgi:hypothetical protein